MLDRIKELASPGFSKKQQKESRAQRPAGTIPDTAGEGKIDPRVPPNETEAMKQQSIRSARYPGDDPEWGHAAEGSMGERVERMSSIAPVMGNPSLDPAQSDLVAISYGAGYASDTSVGFDAMDGIDKLVLGEVDATRELDAPSATEGGALDIAPYESVYSDDYGIGTHDMQMNDTAGDCMTEFRLHSAESESTKQSEGPFDYTRCL